MKISEIKIGETYNNIQVLADLGRINKNRMFFCKCLLCGKEYEQRASRIGNESACRQCSDKAKIIDLTGQRFGRLVAMKYIGRENGRTLWQCKCDCGNESITGYSNLLSGNTRSCGCMEEENRLSNMKKAIVERTKCVSNPLEFGVIGEHPLHKIWSSMITRCYNPNRKSYKDYGGRGIKVCDRWKGDNGFENFIKDMGERPSPQHTLDRIDYNGDYTPENCRWATQKEQVNNQTKNVYLYIKGKRITAKMLCELLGINYNTMIHQLKCGVDINAIIFYRGLDLRTKSGRLMRDSCKNFNREISDRYAYLIPNIDNLLNKI